MLPPAGAEHWQDSDTVVATVSGDRVSVAGLPCTVPVMNTGRARIRTGIVTGLAAASLTLAGCTDVSGENGGDNGGEEQQEQEEGDD